MNNYSLKWEIIIPLLKGCNSYSLVCVIISKINLISNKQNFYVHITIMKMTIHKKK